MFCKTGYRLGGSLKIKMADGGIQSSIFIVKHDGSIDFWIHGKTSVQEILVFHVGIFDFNTPFSENKPNSSLHSKKLLFFAIFWEALWYSGEHSCLLSSRSGFDSRTSRRDKTETFTYSCTAIFWSIKKSMLPSCFTIKVLLCIPPSAILILIF